MALTQGKKGKALGFGDYLSTGVRSLFTPAFSLPIIALGIAVSYIVKLTVGPLIDSGLEQTGSSSAQVGQFLSGIAIAFVAGLFINVYGQVYAVMATASAKMPTVGEAANTAVSRWLNVLAAGLLGAVCTVGILVGGLLIVGIGSEALGSQTGAGLLLLFCFVFVYMMLRLGQTGWFAADGMGPVDALKASWSKTEGSLWRIFGWSIGGGIVFSIIGAVFGLIVQFLPAEINVPVSTGISLCFTYGSGAVMYRRVTSK
jgi:ABC-type multidrug transport system fused ATPase/permease subunit